MITTCSSHDDCSDSTPFCYSGYCAPCNECHYCWDGIDGTCGSCNSSYPLYGEECDDSSDDSDCTKTSDRCILVFVFVGLFYISLFINYRTFVWIENPLSGLVSVVAEKELAEAHHNNVASRASSADAPTEGTDAGQTVELQQEPATESQDEVVQEEPAQEAPAQASAPVEDGGDTTGNQ